jgi:chromosome segregation ATPase
MITIKYFIEILIWLFFAKNNQIEILQNKFETFQTNYNNLQNKFETLQINHNNLQNKCEDYENKFETFQINHNILQNKCEDYENKFKILKTNYNNLQNKFKILKTNYNNLQNKFKENQNKFETLEQNFDDEIDEILTNYNDLQNKCEEYENKFETLEQNFNEKLNDNSYEIQKLIYCNNEDVAIELLKNQFDKFQTNYNNLQNKCEEYENKFKTLEQKFYEKLNNDIDEMQEIQNLIVKNFNYFNEKNYCLQNLFEILKNGFFKNELLFEEIVKKYEKQNELLQELLLFKKYVIVFMNANGDCSLLNLNLGQIFGKYEIDWETQNTLWNSRLNGYTFH